MILDRVHTCLGADMTASRRTSSAKVRAMAAKSTIAAFGL